MDRAFLKMSLLVRSLWQLSIMWGWLLQGTAKYTLISLIFLACYFNHLYIQFFSIAMLQFIVMFTSHWSNAVSNHDKVGTLWLSKEVTGVKQDRLWLYKKTKKQKKPKTTPKPSVCDLTHCKNSVWWGLQCECTCVARVLFSLFAHTDWLHHSFGSRFSFPSYNCHQRHYI